MPLFARHRTPIAAASALGVFALLEALVLPVEQAVVVSNLAQCLAPALAALACLRASRRAVHRDHERSWRFLAGSALSWSLGQMAWTFYDASGVAAPFPSLADVGYLAAIPLALTGVFFLSSRSSARNRAVGILDGLIVATALLAISWPFALGPSWDAGGDSPFSFALSLAYPIGTLVVASSVLLAIMRNEARQTSIPLGTIATALLVLASADSLFVWTTIKGTEQQVSPSDLGWVGGYLILLVAATAFPLHAPDPKWISRARGPEVVEFRRAMLPITVAGAALLVRVSLLVVGGRDVFLDVITAAIIALVLARHLLTVRENQELTASLKEKIDELTTREGQLTHQAFHDPLTGLANRRLFGDRVEHALSRSRRTGEDTGVLFVDLDDFKVVNDSLGHASGDRLLIAVGARLSGCVRPGDTVARLGGDEFGILLEELEASDQPEIVARRILEALDVPFPVDGRQVFTRASIGIAVAEPTDRPDGDHLLADADAALYAAKAAGKATVRRFEGAMRVSAMERLELGQDLRRAVNEDQFFCHYQPIIDLVNGRVVALEALVRWNHPVRGLLHPAAFISMAEETGVISRLGMHVLQSSATQAAAWRVAGKIPADLELHVNLSGRQLEDAHLVADVRRILSTSGFPPQLLVLEITESVAVDIAAQHLERLIGLRDLGARLAIDDFGTGYSSLSYLRTLPIDVLKIDRAFAQPVDGSTDQVLLEAIVKLGHSLGIDVIAEGIDREEQAAALRRMGCRRAQGFLFSRPIAGEAVPTLLALGTLSAGTTPPPTTSVLP